MSRPLNFLHLTTFYPPYSFGGDGLYIYRLAHALGDQGHHVDVVHCVDAYHLLHPTEPEIPFSGHPNVHVHRLVTRHKRLSTLITHQTGLLGLNRRAVQQIFNSKPYDVVHFHNISLIGPEVLRLQPLGNPAIKVYTTHEHWLICPTHVLWKFNNRPCDKAQCLPCTILNKRPPQLWRYTGLLRRASRHVDQFFAPSRFTARMHAERGFSQPMGHLPSFIERVDNDWIEPGPPPQTRPYFLFVGRLEVIKGLQTLISIWDQVPQADLLVAGTGGYEEQLRRMAAVKSNIKFLGAVPQTELGSLYYHAMACIVPSITYETFGIVIIEAFARKTPVIVRDLGPFPEAVNDSGGGYVYRTEEELLDAIKRIATSPGLRSELGENGYAAFLRTWSKEAHLTLYFDHMRRIAFKKFGHVPWEEQEGSRANSSSSGILAPHIVT